jgi:hypothetical protein
MPRGGKRPGAGAPKGNLNGLRRGNHSERLFMVLLAVREHPAPKELAHELLHAGFLRPRNHRFTGDLRGVVAYLYDRWFENPGNEPPHLKCNQTHRRPRRPKTPPPDTEQRPTAPEQP